MEKKHNVTETEQDTDTSNVTNLQQTDASGSGQMSYTEDSGTDVNQMPIYKRAGTTYFNYPPPDYQQNQPFNPQPTGYIPNVVLPQGTGTIQMYQPATQYIPPMAYQHPVVQVPNVPQMYAQFQNVPQYGNVQPTPSQPMNPYPNASKQQGSNVQHGQKRKISSNKNKKQSGHSKYQHTKREQTKPRKEEKKEKDSGVYPFFFPSPSGLIPRYVNSTGMQLIHSIAEQCKVDPTQNADGHFGDRDSGDIQSAIQQHVSSTESSSAAVSRTSVFLEGKSKHGQQHYRKQGVPWPYIPMKRKSGSHSSRGSGNGKSIVVITNRRESENTPKNRKRNEHVWESEDSRDLSSITTSMSRVSIDKDNRSAPTSTEALHDVSDGLSRSIQFSEQDYPSTEKKTTNKSKEEKKKIDDNAEPTNQDETDENLDPKTDTLVHHGQKRNR